MDSTMKVTAYRLSAAAGLLAALTLFLHGSALQGYWRIDDPMVLLYVIEHPKAWWYFFSPEQWQALSVPFFTPWLVLDYWLDYRLLGLNSLAFYAHHLFFVWLAALLTFVLLLRYVDMLWAGGAAILFLLGSPVVVISQELQARHYATGLVFAILAILFWLRARSLGSRPSLALAAAFYLAAMLNKEIFAPLPLMLFFLDSATLKERLRAMSPFLLTSSVFIAWRSVMLGKVIGGYSNGFHEAVNIATSLVALPKVFFGEGWLALSGSLIILLAAGLLLRYSPRRAMTTLFAAVFALSLPFLAIRVSMEIIDLRFAFMPWWGACVLLSLGLGGVRRRNSTVTEHWGMHQCAGHHLVLLAALVFFCMAAAKSLETAKDHAAAAAEFDVQGRFLWDHDETASYIPSGHVSEIFQFQYSIPALKMALLHTGAPAAIPFVESAPFLAGNSPFYFYNPDCHCMKKETALTQSAAPQVALPQDVFMDREKNGFAWHFTVPAGTACYLVFPGRNIAFIVPCSGQISYSIPAWVQGSFRLFARATGGQWGGSPPFLFPEKGQKLKWSNEQVPSSRATE